MLMSILVTVISSEANISRIKCALMLELEVMLVPLLRTRLKKIAA